MLVVNAATISVDEANLKKYLSASVRLENVSDKTAKLDVQGPLSMDALKDIFGDGLSKLGYYTFSDFVFEKECCIISRTGYTGELGFEVYLPSRLAVKLWVRLLKDPRVKPAGLGCRDTLRLEMGYPLYGQDIDTVHTPLAAGLDKFVDFSKDFIGKPALLEEKKRGPKERLVCFKAPSRRSPRHGFGIYSGSSSVGLVASGSFSPSLSVGIGMGYVRSGFDIGSELLVKDGSTEIPVTVVKKPFYSKTPK
jgi:aminomethyltransferase